MKDLNKDANAALAAATARVNDSRSYFSSGTIATTEMAVRLASAHAQMAMARQAEITNLLQAREVFADAPLAHADITGRLIDLLGL